MECPQCGLTNPDTTVRCDCGYDFEEVLMECPQCGLTNPDTAVRCDCGYDFLEQRVKSQIIDDKRHVKSQIADDRRYKTLYTYSKILQVIGWIIIVIGFVIIAGSLIGLTSQQFATMVGILMYGVGMGLAGLVLIATGQLICVWRDTEENTRKIASLLENSKIS